MQRPEPENLSRDRYFPQRPKNRNEIGKIPRRNGLFQIDHSFRGSGGLDGGDDLDQNCMLPTQSSNQSPNLEPGTEFFAAETGAQKSTVPPLRDRYRDAQRFEKPPFWRH